jgi:hypothetical protein
MQQEGSSIPSPPTRNLKRLGPRSFNHIYFLSRKSTWIIPQSALLDSLDNNVDFWQIYSAPFCIYFGKDFYWLKRVKKWKKWKKGIS